jgi:hypothetical protein
MSPGTLTSGNGLSLISSSGNADVGKVRASALLEMHQVLAELKALLLSEQGSEP